jgi:hypothetical protein
MRSLETIAREIRNDWKKIDPVAKEYVIAMYFLNNVNDTYIAESGRSVVLYFLSSAQGWRGETARRIKTELKQMLCQN